MGGWSDSVLQAGRRLSSIQCQLLQTQEVQLTKLLSKKRITRLVIQLKLLHVREYNGSPK